MLRYCLLLARRQEAADSARAEPMLSSFINAAICSQRSFSAAVAFVLAHRLADANEEDEMTTMYAMFRDALSGTRASTLADLLAVRTRVRAPPDPSPVTNPFLMCPHTRGPTHPMLVAYALLGGCMARAQVPGNCQVDVPIFLLLHKAGHLWRPATPVMQHHLTLCLGRQRCRSSAVTLLPDLVLPSLEKGPGCSRVLSDHIETGRL